MHVCKTYIRSLFCFPFFFEWKYPLALLHNFRRYNIDVTWLIISIHSYKIHWHNNTMPCSTLFWITSMQWQLVNHTNFMDLKINDEPVLAEFIFESSVLYECELQFGSTYDTLWWIRQRTRINGANEQYRIDVVEPDSHTHALFQYISHWMRIEMHITSHHITSKIKVSKWWCGCCKEKKKLR